MTRKEQRKLRRCRGVTARENYLRNKRDWLDRYGPRAVMEEPTEIHVKALLMEWVAVRNVLKRVSDETKFRPKKPTYEQLLRMLLSDAILPEIEPVEHLRHVCSRVLARMGEV